MFEYFGVAPVARANLVEYGIQHFDCYGVRCAKPGELIGPHANPAVARVLTIRALDTVASVVGRGTVGRSKSDIVAHLYPISWQGTRFRGFDGGTAETSAKVAGIGGLKVAFWTERQKVRSVASGEATIGGVVLDGLPSVDNY